MWFEEFVARIKAMPRMLMMTRSALMNDDWDVAYKDDLELSYPQNQEVSPQINTVIKKENNFDDPEITAKAKALEAFMV